MKNVTIVWARTRVEAKVKARKVFRREGVGPVGRVTLIPTERFERVKAWYIEAK